jgi:hypothetical protein
MSCILIYVVSGWENLAECIGWMKCTIKGIYRILYETVCTTFPVCLFMILQPFGSYSIKY